MALYMPASRRRRRLVLALLAAAVVGAVIGGFAGRGLAPSLRDRVDDVQEKAREASAELRAMPVNYEKERVASGEFRRGGGVADALERAHADLRAALDAAVWLGPSARADAEAAFARVETAHRRAVAPARFEAVVRRSAADVDAVFGIDAPG